MVQPLHVMNARVWNGRDAEIRDLYTTDIVVDAPPLGALAVDLDGYTIFPGLINAHDHLELNHYPRSKFREVYNNAHEWGEDVNARLDESPFKELRAYPLWDRLFIGGLKNLLCGATTVAHHNPPYKELFRKDFPVRVLRKYGWAHSLHFSTDEEIVASYRRTPKYVPWFIHLGEGTDRISALEYEKLKALGCLGENTVIVHGIGVVDENDIRPHKDIRGLVWCPSTNNYLLNKTIDAYAVATIYFIEVAIGSDSRLTADGDLLDELRAATNSDLATILGDNWLVYMVTDYASEILCTSAGSLKISPNVSNYADLIAICSTDDDAFSLCHSRRADLALVVKGGVPQIGDPDVMAKFPHIQAVPAMLDGKPKSIHIDLAKRITKCQLKEPGLEVEAPPKRSLFAVGR